MLLLPQQHVRLQPVEEGVLGDQHDVGVAGIGGVFGKVQDRAAVGALGRCYGRRWPAWGGGTHLTYPAMRGM